MATRTIELHIRYFKADEKVVSASGMAFCTRVCVGEGFSSGPLAQSEAPIEQ